ncbi:MAG: TatD family hydrolase [Asgard group archaeon]|nr:TatD family hydrolase [Asgard group archaeon]
MKLHDVHCHLPKNYFYMDIENYMERWISEGLEVVISVATKYKESLRSIELHSKFNQIVPGIGVHPWSAKRKLTEEIKENFELLILDNKNVVLGEIGLDCHFIDKEEYYPIQEEYFKFFLGLSEKHGIPVNIHGKGAEGVVAETLTSFKIPPNNVLMHWYSGPKKILSQFIDRGYFFSINPSVLTGSSHIEVLKATPKDQILTESDGNVKYTIDDERIIGSPALIPRVLEKISEWKQIENEEISDILHSNLKRYLNIE